MITLIHFENGRRNFDTEKEFISFVQKIFTENGDEEHMSMPSDAEDCAKYVIDFCGNFTMVYYQPNFTETEFFDNDIYSFQVYLQKENLLNDFPFHKAIEYHDNDIEDFSVIDYTESYNINLN